MNRQFLKMLKANNNYFNTLGEFNDRGGGIFDLLRVHCGKSSSIYIGKDCEIFDCVFYADDGASIIIGNNCELNGLVIRAEGEDSIVRIGESSCARGDANRYNTIVCSRGTAINIGNECILGGGVEIYSAEEYRILNLGDETPESQPDSVTIGDHVWIKSGAIIEKGVYVGHDSIIDRGAHLSHGSGFKSCSMIRAKTVPSQSSLIGIEWTK